MSSGIGSSGSNAGRSGTCHPWRDGGVTPTPTNSSSAGESEARPPFKGAELHVPVAADGVGIEPAAIRSERREDVRHGTRVRAVADMVNDIDDPGSCGPSRLEA